MLPFVSIIYYICRSIQQGAKNVSREVKECKKNDDEK